MNLVTTFDPPPPVTIWRMSDFEKMKMRLNFSTFNAKLDRTLIKSGPRNVSEAPSCEPSRHQRFDNNISIFEGDILYENKICLGAAATDVREIRNSEKPSSSMRNYGKLLSNFVDDDRRPKQVLNAKKPKDFRGQSKSVISGRIIRSELENIDVMRSSSRNNINFIENSSTNNKIDTSSNSSDQNRDDSGRSTINTEDISITDHVHKGDIGCNIRNVINTCKSDGMNKKVDNISSAKDIKKSIGDNNQISKAKSARSKDPEPAVPADWLSRLQSQQENVNTNPSAKFHKSDFAGIGSFCRNAGSTTEGLSSFVNKAYSAERFAVSVMWRSRSSSGLLSSNHSTSTMKYCTPSVSCHRWYCSCDRHIRVQQAFEPLLGALILFPDELQHSYFLPLSKCINPASSAPGADSDSEGAIPLNCQTTLQDRWQAFLRILLNKNTRKIIYNFQLALLPLLAACYGLRDDVVMDNNLIGDLTVIQNVFDPRIAAYLCETDTQESGFEFNALCDKFKIGLEEIPQKDLGSVSVAVGRSYSELKGLFQLQSHLQVEIERRDSMRVFLTLEMPLVPLLSSMELRGLEMSQNVLKDLSDKIELKIAAIIVDAHKSAGQLFNLASPEQVANILYVKLKLPIPQNSAKGRHSSTAEEDLLKIRALHPLVDMILSFRSLSKVSTTYIAGLRPFFLQRKNKITPMSTDGSTDIPQSHLLPTNPSKPSNFIVFDGKRQKLDDVSVSCRVHANWNQTTVRTGRLSCCRPNLQNIPNRQIVSDIEIVVRSAFKASEGCILVAADYSQIEMRVMAQLCQDPKMMSLFGGSGDIYRLMAAQILGKGCVSTVTQEERNKAKVICLGTIYGMGPALAASKLGIDITAANRITHAFFNNYTHLKLWMSKIKNEARRDGYVRTVQGRRRYLPDISSPDPSKRAQAERQAVNSVVQGSASDIIKLAMVGVEAALIGLPQDVRVTRMGDPQLLMQIHDELIYEVRVIPGHLGGAVRVSDEFQSLLQRCMGAEVMRALRFVVPLTITIKTGPDWGNMTE